MRCALKVFCCDGNISLVGPCMAALGRVTERKRTLFSAHHVEQTIVWTSMHPLTYCGHTLGPEPFADAEATA